MVLNKNFHNLFYKLFKFKWRNPFITTSKILLRGRMPKRVLGIWDFENGRAAIGDAIAFHEILLVIAEENKIDKIDIAFVNPQLRNLKSNIYQIVDSQIIEDIISLNKINPKLGSYYVFDNNSQFSNFFNTFKGNYLTFPNPLLPFSTVTNHYHITDFYEKNHYIPELKIDIENLEWGKGFIDEHCNGKIPVVVALRKNNSRDITKNSPIQEWIKFLHYTEKEYNNLKFIIIGAKNEIISELVGKDNIVFAKLYNSTLLQDLTLIELCRFFMGHASGVSGFAWYINKPSVFLGMDEDHVHWGHAIRLNEEYNHLNDLQQMYWGKYTSIDIIRSFEFLVNNCKNHEEILCS